MRMAVLGWQGRNGRLGIAASGMQHWDFSIRMAAWGHDSKRMAAPQFRICRMAAWRWQCQDGSLKPEARGHRTRMEVLGWQGGNGRVGIAASFIQHWEFSFRIEALGHDS